MVPCVCFLALVGAPVPMPAVTDLQGAAHRLLSGRMAEPTAVVFLSHDCPICNSYLPDLERTAATYRGRVRFAFVFSEPNLSRTEARRHAEAFKMPAHDIYLDPDGSFAHATGATVLPEAAVFDPTGKRTYLGRIDDWYYDFGKQRTRASHHDLRDALDATLSHKPAKPASGPPFGCVIETSSKP